MDNVNFGEASVSIKGTTTGGKLYELTADVDEFSIEVDRQVAPIYSWEDRTPFDVNVVNASTYWIKLKRKKNGEAYRIQMETTDIEHKVKLPIKENTLANINAARERCGAPESASVWVGKKTNDVLDCVFTWKETVVV